MKRLLIATLLLTGMATIAAAQSKPTTATPDKPHEITVREARALSQGLRNLDGVQTGKLDNAQAQVIEPFRFSGPTRMTIALNLAAVDTAVVAYQKARNGLIKQMAGGGATVPADKQQAFIEQDDRMQDSPAGVIIRRLKESELCLEAKAPCEVANQIPGSTLGQLVPIIDR